MARIRVLYFIEGTGGGAETYVLNLANLMPKEEIQPLIVFFLNGPSVEKARHVGLTYKLIPWKFSLDPILILRLWKILREEKIDIIHTHTITGNFYGRIAAKLSGNTIIVTTVHSYVIPEMRGNTEVSLKDKLRYKRDVWMSGTSDQFIAVAKGVREKLIDIGTPKRRIAVIRHGVELPEISPPSSRTDSLRNEFNIAKDDAVIGIVGRLIPLKNHQLFLKTAKEVLKVRPKAKFLIIGDGILKEHLIELAKNLNISKNVIFTGWRNDINKFYQLIDILVLCSISESQGLAILEAMAQSKPVVAVDINEIAETIIHGETGLIVPFNDVKALVDAILILVDNRSMARQMGEKGRESIEKKFSVMRMVEETASLYYKLYSKMIAEQRIG